MLSKTKTVLELGSTLFVEEIAEPLALVESFRIDSAGAREPNGGGTLCGPWTYDPSSCAFCLVLRQEEL